MDFTDDMLDDQSLPFTPSWFPPSPEPFPQSMEFMQDPIMDEEFGGLFSIPAISEANPLTSIQPSLIPCPESLTIPEDPPDMQQEQPSGLQHSDQQDLLNPNMLNCFQEPDVSTMQPQQQPPLSNSHGSLQQSDQQSLLDPNMMYSFQEPDASTMQQQPPSNSHGYIQQSDQQGLLNPNMLNSFHEPDVSTMQQQQPLSNSHGYVQQSDQQDLLNQNRLNSFQEPGVSAMQQQQLLCDSHGYIQGNLSNRQSDQRYLLNQNVMNSFQDPNDSTMICMSQIDIVQQIEEGNNTGNAHQPLIDSFELPNHLQEQFLSVPVSENYMSYPAYQHGPIGSHFNMYDQQPPPRLLTNREDEHLVPRMVTDLAITYPLQNQNSTTLFRPQMPSSSTRTYARQNQISMIPPQSQMPSSSTRTYPLQNQNSMMPPQSQMPSSSTRTPQQNQISMLPPQSQISSRSTRTYLLQNQISMTSPQLQIPSSSTKHHDEAQELESQPLPSFRCPQLDTSTQIRTCKNSFTTRIQTSVLGRRQRNYQNHFVHGESSSSAQRKRIVLPKRNVDSNAANLGEERIQNSLYNPLYEGLGLAIDPILRKFHFQA